MRVIKWGCFIFKINLTMEVIENFFSLGYNKLEVNKDLMRLMRLPALPKVKEALEKEITPITPLLAKELKKRCAEMGKLDSYYKLSPQDIQLAYSGYIKLIYNLGNLYIVAERKSKDAQAQPFIFNEELSREETFNKVGLEVK